MIKKNSKSILFGALLFILVLILIKNLTSSFFFHKKDRINFVIYDKNPVFYSLGIRDQIHYRLDFYPDFNLVVPGGYGEYRVGAIGKLISLEKASDILKKTFSLATVTFIDGYFYRNSREIYYGNEKSAPLPNLAKFFTYSSNLNFLDRLYIYWQFISKKKQDFSDLSLEKKREFAKLYSGYFFQKTYRDEKNNIQVQYNTDYNTANEISNIIEGNGIRVVDISEKTNKEKKCQIIEGSDKYSKSAIDLANFFDCELKKGMTETSDIIIILGELEREWEIK